MKAEAFQSAIFGLEDGSFVDKLERVLLVELLILNHQLDHFGDGCGLVEDPLELSLGSGDVPQP